ncbi:MAG: tRNA (adenosine(37)-N6)-threonylcarbamoyltransferase complex dimerization subunit type 1 TsaB [Erysipelotrichaceae bacterium]|nr:tRNA (adenosine(37)-N6)-threonylcarbamoyltransferase complex dimerization subunit type 1 TsaB [Erysipelotrichaceae bacterium]
MLTLCIDTAYKYLTVCLIKDDEIVTAISDECFKRQSEQVFVALEELFKSSDYKKEDIDSVCISRGPGSYTGVRISMSIAKVLCQVKKLKLFTVSTLRLYAGDKEKQLVVMNARANRAYVGGYDKDVVTMEDQILTLEEIDPKDNEVICDGSLIGLEDVNPDIPLNFLNTKKYWEEVSEINFLAPEYLKENSAYFNK